MAKRKAAKRSKTAPAARTRGITKRPAEERPRRTRRQKTDLPVEDPHPEFGPLSDFGKRYGPCEFEKDTGTPCPIHRIDEMEKRLPLSQIDEEAKTKRKATRPRGRKRTAAAAPETPLIAEEAPAPAVVPSPLRHAVCPNRPNCYTRASWDPKDSPEELLAQGFTHGFDPDAVTGFPICTNCRTTMVSAEPVEVPEAMRQAAAAAGSHQPRLWEDPPFNFAGAYLQLEEKDDEILGLKDASEAAQKVARKAQKAYAKALHERTAISAELKQWRLKKQREALTRADAREPVAAPAAYAESACLFEVETNSPCKICRADSPSLVVAAFPMGTMTALTDRRSRAHRELATRANSVDVDVTHERTNPVRVARALQLGGLHGITGDVVETWDDVQRAQALAWVDLGCDRAHVPEVLGLPHVAAEPGEGEQHCGECGARLMAFDERDGASSFPVGAFVGLHCTGVEPVEQPAAPQAAHA